MDQQQQQSDQQCQQQVTQLPPDAQSSAAGTASFSQPPSYTQTLQYQVHHSYMWFESVRRVLTVLVVAFVVALSIFSMVTDRFSNLTNNNLATGMAAIGVVSFVVAVVATAIVIYQILSYRYLFYELGPEEFNVYRGILNKKRVHVPYRRIQSVDQHATFMQRILGVCTVSIGTAGGSSNKAITVPYVEKGRAEELRQELFTRKQYQLAMYAAPTADITPAAEGAMPLRQESHNTFDAAANSLQNTPAAFADNSADAGQVTYEHGLSNAELIFTGLSNGSAFTTVVLGVAAVFGRISGVVVPFLFGSFERGMQFLGANTIIFVVVVFLFAVSLVVWLFSAVGNCILFGGFRACRRGNRIEIEHGLLQHRVQGVDVDRIQSVIVRQSLIRRILGYCELSIGKVDAVEGRSSQQTSFSSQGMVLHPFVKLNRVPEILAGLLPEFADVPVDNMPVAKVALRRAVIRRGFLQSLAFWFAILISIVQRFANFVLDPAVYEGDITLVQINMLAMAGYAFCFVFIALNIVGAVLWSRSSGFAYNRKFMQVSNGGFARETVSFPRQKIQFGYTRANPLQQRAHTATIYIRTAAGVGGTSVRLIDAQKDDAFAWLTWLEPHTNRSSTDFDLSH